MRTLLFSSAAAALLLMAAPQIASAQAAPSDTSVRNPDAQVPITKALSPTGRTLDDANSAPAGTPAPAASIEVPAPTVSASSDVSAAAAAAPLASTDASATVTTSLVTNGPVADTPENRARFGQPLSNAGRRTAARGN
jgi:hypothetical protein